jgi:Na+/alanine symporter
MANNPILCAAIMTVWLVALPGFVIISSVSVIVNVMSFVVPATACLLIFLFFGCHYNSSVGSVIPYYKM